MWRHSSDALLSFARTLRTKPSTERSRRAIAQRYTRWQICSRSSTRPCA
jgi:hypothetical protein